MRQPVCRINFKQYFKKWYSGEILLNLDISKDAINSGAHWDNVTFRAMSLMYSATPKNVYISMCPVSPTLLFSEQNFNNCNHQVRSYCTIQRIPLHLSQFLFSNESTHCCVSEFVCIARLSIGFVHQKAWRVPLLGLQPLDTSSFSILNTSLLWLSTGAWTD